MASYLLVAVIVACLSAWFGFNLQPFTFNTLRFQRLFTTTAPTPFTFYKLSLQWPPATCNSGTSCKPPTPREFTIHGIWPQDQNDKPVPPYDPKNPCTSVTPTPASNLATELMPIQTDLTALWPNLKDPQSSQANLNFWEHEWTKHGMCSDYPDKPRDYFNSALQLRKGFDPVMGLTPGSQYTVQAVSTIIQTKVGATPEIACNRAKVGKTLQLWEIRLCYNRAMPPNTVQNCPKQFSGQCKNLTDLITFPS
ncbi:hypothetical protein CRYUN_Cryun03dG0138100 [Craigia yunnanensis]